MALIPNENISELHNAMEVLDVANNAEIDIERSAVARAINIAANTGSTRIPWNKALSDEVKSELEDNGYKVIARNNLGPTVGQYFIDWSGK